MRLSILTLLLWVIIESIIYWDEAVIYRPKIQKSGYQRRHVNNSLAHEIFQQIKVIKYMKFIKKTEVVIQARA